MASITIHFKDGNVEDFPHLGRPGGSYTKSVRYEGGMVIVKDEWGKESAFPTDDVERVESVPVRF